MGQQKNLLRRDASIDVQRSAEFYEKVFGWQVRERGDGAIAFDDGVGQVSGTWVTGRPATTPGLLIYIMVATAGLVGLAPWFQQRAVS